MRHASQARRAFHSNSQTVLLNHGSDDGLCRYVVARSAISRSVSSIFTFAPSTPSCSHDSGRHIMNNNDRTSAMFTQSHGRPIKCRPYVGGCWFSMAMVRQADVDYGDMLMIYATQLLLITKFAVFHFKHSSVTNRGHILDVLQL